MFIKQLKIESKDGIIRDIIFNNHLNLIVDNTPESVETATGNNVGKTTILQLIDFCLGAKADKILKDNETKQKLLTINNFLTDQDNKVLITLVLVDKFTNDAQKIVIQRNFLKKPHKILKINDHDFSKSSEIKFIEYLDQLLIGKRYLLKPSLRQIIAYNVRYSEERTNKTLNIFPAGTSSAEYENIYLFLFGFKVSQRDDLLKAYKEELSFKKKLVQGKEEMFISSSQSLSIIENNIKKLNEQKSNLVINENYEDELELLNTYKIKIYELNTEINDLTVRKQLLEETIEELKNNSADLTIDLLSEIYQHTTKFNLGEINKNFNNVLNYHNQMIIEKINFISEDIPQISEQISDLENDKQDISVKKNQLETKLSESSSLADLENIIEKLNKEFEKKGQIETLIKQTDVVDKKINELNEKIEKIEKEIFSDDFKNKLDTRLKKFNNDFFTVVSRKLYDEDYGITYQIKQDKNTNKPIYHFSSFNNNTSTGKKQGEIICFDLAHILFARKYQIPHLDFILNDRKELMYGHQLIEAYKYAKENNIQLVFSILRDKLPKELDNQNNIVVELSQKEKLFKI